MSLSILLTGANGFVGSHLARWALADGCAVTAVVRPRSNLYRLADIRERLDVVEADLQCADALEIPLRKKIPDIAVHLAWYTEPGGRCLWAPENIECLTGSLALLHRLYDIGCPRIVLAGTSVEYAPSTGHVSEASPPRPANLYAAAKHALFLTASQFDPHGGWQVATARMFSLYGPWEDPRRLVPFVIGKLLAAEPCDLTTGEQIRDYLHVEDCAAAVWAIAKSTVTGPVNVGSSQPASVASVATQLGKILGRSELLRFGARPSAPDAAASLVANTDRLRGEIGWRPGYDLTTGLEQTVDWWRARRRV